MNDVQEFIKKFTGHTGHPSAEMILQEQFANGYCWHFAHVLKDAFRRGAVVWLAPSGHIGFKDVNGKVYDIGGEYHGDAFYEIPEVYLGHLLDGFRHIGDPFCTTTEELVEVCRRYCTDTGTLYDPAIEGYFEGKRRG